MSISNLSSKWLTVSSPLPSVVLIQLNREPVNAFSTEFWQAYGTLWTELIAKAPENDTRVAVLASSIPGIFTAGLDLSEPLLPPPSPETDPARAAHTLRTHIHAFQHAISAPARAPFPVIAAMHGLVLGLGVDIACWCDIRVVAQGGQFGVKEVDVGLSPDIGTLALLTKLTSSDSLVRELVYTGRLFGAEEALRLGFVSAVVEVPSLSTSPVTSFTVSLTSSTSVSDISKEKKTKQDNKDKKGKTNKKDTRPRDLVLSQALVLAKMIAGKSPVAVAGVKEVLGHARDHSVQENMDYVAVWNSAMLQTKDLQDSIAAVRNKTTATYAPLGIKGKL